MTTGRTVNVEAICKRPLRLFINGDNAWDHMRDHALGMRQNGEEQGWRLLLPALEAELAAGRLQNLRDVARATRLKPGHARLGPIYGEFLDSVQADVERASVLKWYWETKPGPDGRWSTVGHQGMFAHLDEDFVRTGYLPETDSLAWSSGTEAAGFRLFLACLKRVKTKYNRAWDSGRIEKIQPALKTLLTAGLDEASWQALQ